MGRKSKLEANIGGNYDRKPPPISSARDAILLVERLLYSLLQGTIDMLKGNEAELTRFFSHFFDPTTGTAERDEFVKRFMAKPPKALLGYARSTAQFPCFAIVLEGEEEEDAFVGDFVGETTEEEESPEAYEYTGAFFRSIYGVYIYSEHPDECGFLYQFAKSVVHAGKASLISSGVLEVSLSGTELNPDQQYLPENLFVRILRVTAKSPMSVPHIPLADPGKIRVTGVFRQDVVVDGMPGQVTTYTDEDDE